MYSTTNITYSKVNAMFMHIIFHARIQYEREKELKRIFCRAIFNHSFFAWWRMHGHRWNGLSYKWDCEHITLIISICFLFILLLHLLSKALHVIRVRFPFFFFYSLPFLDFGDCFNFICRWKCMEPIRVSVWHSYQGGMDAIVMWMRVSLLFENVSFCVWKARFAIGLNRHVNGYGKLWLLWDLYLAEITKGSVGEADLWKGFIFSKQWIQF